LLLSSACSSSQSGEEHSAGQRDLLKIYTSCARDESSKVQEFYLKAALEDFVRELESHSSLGHYQDMNVIGAGPGDDELLQAGMVFAIEPVLYAKQLNFAVFLEASFW